MENFIAKNIPNIKVIKAEATYLMWLDISNFGLDSTTFTKKLEELGNVRVISGVTFGENGDNFIRVNIATPLEILKEALEGIKRVVNLL
ncbi:Cystathionine beta-lyase PatB [Aliarcobacter thereius]|nr:Cystathionine beta-lyase PatB [Aliarcobacter thereius]